jgi:hypothetical protein
MEPTERSQRPAQLPAVSTSQPGVTNSISTPSRSAISRPTSMSKPSNSFWSLSEDWGGYSGSVDMTMTPFDVTRSSTSPACDAGGAKAQASAAAAAIID